jgi:hypothetical protein
MDGVKVNGVAVLVIASQAFVYEGEESLGQLAWGCDATG